MSMESLCHYSTVFSIIHEPAQTSHHHGTLRRQARLVCDVTHKRTYLSVWLSILGSIPKRRKIMHLLCLAICECLHISGFRVVANLANEVIHFISFWLADQGILYSLVG